MTTVRKRNKAFRQIPKYWTTIVNSLSRIQLSQFNTEREGMKNELERLLSQTRLLKAETADTPLAAQCGELHKDLTATIERFKAKFPYLSRHGCYQE